LAYSFKPGAAVPREVRRIAGEELDAAVASLKGGRLGRDESIHDARKRIKKVRALLRLVREELGGSFDSNNIRLRDAGRALSQFRDAAVTLETFDALREKCAGEIGKQALPFVRQGLIVHKSRLERPAELERILREAPSELLAVRREMDRLPISSDGFSAISPGLRTAFRNGRKAMETARADPRAEHFHAWRKRVKDHWYHVRLLQDLRKDELNNEKDRLKKLEDALGNDHNLEVLRGVVASEAGLYGSAGDIDLLFRVIESHQKELREESLALGEHVYKERTKDLVARLGELWEFSRNGA
jgi:CHAD domain-containing protein